MSPEITDYFGKASIDTGYAIATTVDATRSPGATVLEVVDVSKFSDETPVFFITYKKTTDPETGVVSVIDLRSFKGIVNTGANTITNLEIAPGYVDDLGNDEGDFVECIPTSYWGNSLIDGILISLDPTGKLKVDAPITGGTDLTTLNNGWVNAAETWDFASFDAATDTGTITVPTNATNKYSAGMKIRLSQSTGGTKYGIITKVEATLLTVHFGTDYTLVDEDITAPYFSMVKAPIGFPLAPEKWTLETISANNRTISSATLASLTDSLVVPIGAWTLSLKAAIARPYDASTSNDQYEVTLSSTTTTETNPDLTAIFNLRFGSATASSGGKTTFRNQEDVLLTAQTTFTVLGQRQAGANGSLSGADVPTIIRAVNAYL